MGAFTTIAFAAVTLGPALGDGLVHFLPIATASITLGELTTATAGFAVGLTPFGMTDPLGAAMVSIVIVNPAEFETDPEAARVIAIT